MTICLNPAAAAWPGLVVPSVEPLPGTGQEWLARLRCLWTSLPSALLLAKKKPAGDGEEAASDADSAEGPAGADDVVDGEESEEESEEESGEEEEAEESGGSKWKAPRDWSRGADEDDERLIHDFLAGDRESFNRLVLKYQHKVFNLCCRLLSDRHEAEDLAQEIFMTIHKSLKNFRGDSLFSTWLFRISINHGKNRLKYLGRRRYYQSVSIDQPQETEDGDLYHEVEDEGPDPETSIASREVQLIVQQAIGELDPDHRMVIVMRDIEDLSYEEIAEALKIKVGTVKSRIHRARSELKAKLEGKAPV